MAETRLKKQATNPNDTWNVTAKARAHATAAQDNLANGWVKMLFGVEDFDPGSNFASSTFTAPVTGYYMVESGYSVSGGAANTRIGICIFVNGTGYSGGFFGIVDSAGYGGVHISTMVYATAGQTIETYGNSNGNTTTDVYIDSPNITPFMSVHLLSI